MLAAFRPFEAISGVAAMFWFLFWIWGLPAPVLYVAGTVAVVCLCIGIAGHVKAMSERRTLGLGRLWNEEIQHSETPRLQAANGNGLLTESYPPPVSEPERPEQEATPQQDQAIASVKPLYDRFLNHPASVGIPERTYLFYAGPEDAPAVKPIEVKARLRYDSTWSAGIVGIYVNSDSEDYIGNGCVAAIRNYNQIAADLLNEARERNIFFDRTAGVVEIYNEVPLSDRTVNRIARVNPSGLNIEFIGSVPFPRG